MFKFWSTSFKYRLGGNAGLTFIAPFSGANLLHVDMIDCILLSLVATGIVSTAIIFRRMEKWGNRNAST